MQGIPPAVRQPHDPGSPPGRGMEKGLPGAMHWPRSGGLRWETVTSQGFLDWSSRAARTLGTHWTRVLSHLQTWEDLT